MRKIIVRIIVAALSLTGVLGLIGIGVMLTETDDKIRQEQAGIAESVIRFKRKIPFI